MSLLLPLGLLGLIGIIVLILIYIIKPNYLQKVISSTFMWKRSLKYRKKRASVNKITNILIFICQLLIFSMWGLLLARPVLGYEEVPDRKEEILIIDASASMRLTNGESTRFERAVSEAKIFAEQVLNEDGVVTVILADDSPEYLVQRVDAEHKLEVLEKLDALVDGDSVCTYGSVQMQDAVKLARQTMEENPNVNVTLYTATNYIHNNRLQIVDVADVDDWNAAVLQANAALDKDNHYNISIDVGCFGRTSAVTIYCSVFGVNGTQENWSFSSVESFTQNSVEQKTVTYTMDDFPNGTPLYSFQYMTIYVDAGVQDCFTEDDSFYIYGGDKPDFKIQYVSSAPQIFFRSVIGSYRQAFGDRWDIKFSEAAPGEMGASEGYDLYIFENIMPQRMPTDGIVILVNPNIAPENCGFRIDEAGVTVPSSSTLEESVPHPLMQYVNPSQLTINKYQRVGALDSSYIELMSFEGDPMVLVKDSAEEKVVLINCAINYSTLNVQYDFGIFMANVFDYFSPATFDKSVYEVGETIAFTPRGTNFTVQNHMGQEQAVGEDLTLKAATPGLYLAMQETLRLDADRVAMENFFVKVPSVESNISKEVVFPQIDIEETPEKGYEDLLVYFAAAVLTLLCAEWFLHARSRL